MSQVVTWSTEQCTTHTALCTYVPIYFILDIFFVHYFSNFTEFILRGKSLTSPCHLRYQKYSVKILMDSKGLSWLIICNGVVFVQNNTIKGRLSFVPLFLKQNRWLSKLKSFHINDIKVGEVKDIALQLSPIVSHSDCNSPGDQMG